MEGLSNYLTSEQEDKVLDETISYLTEANMVRMDKKTMRRRLFTQATLLAAKEDNSPLYKKYHMHSVKKRELRRQIQLKYASKGRTKVREYEARRKAKKAAPKKK